MVSGDVLSIRDSSSGAERRVTLSSIRAPRPTRRDEKPEPYGLEAKEFLRQRLIGACLPTQPSCSTSAAAKAVKSHDRLLQVWTADPPYGA